MDLPQPTQDTNTEQAAGDFSRSTKDATDNVAVKENTSNLAEGDNIQPKKKSTRKVPSHPPTSEMVLESIKALKMRKGASVDAIRQHMESTYGVNMKVVEPHVKRFLKNGVEKGLLEQVTGAGDTQRFKIKKTEPMKKEIRKKGKIEKKPEKVERKKRAK